MRLVTSNFFHKREISKRQTVALHNSWKGLPHGIYSDDGNRVDIVINLNKPFNYSLLTIDTTHMVDLHASIPGRFHQPPM